MFDLKKNDPALAAEAGFEFEVLLPNGDKTGAFIKVRGENSHQVKAFNRKFAKEQDIREKQNKRRGREDTFDPEERDELSAEIVASRIISWRGFAEDGKEIEFSKEKAAALMLKHDWIARQVMQASNEVHNFRSEAD